MSDDVLEAPYRLEYTYQRSTGPVIGRFLGGLRDGRLEGVRTSTGVMVPPLEYEPDGRATGEPVAVGPGGTVTTWAWVAAPRRFHPLDRPFAFALIRLDGADTALLHAVDAGSPAAMRTGLRVHPRWRAERTGSIRDLECFVPGEAPEVDGEDTGPAAEPIEMMDYLASIQYRNPVPPMADRLVEESRRHRLIGLRCPVCERVYVGGRTTCCPIDSVEFTAEHEVELPHTGTITNFVVVTPVQYPGQTETEPFARVFVLLDGFDVVLGYQPVIELPVDEVRVGRRVGAVWASPAEMLEEGGGMGQTLGALIGWMPLGEPDVDDPDLVNRIF